MDDRIHEYEKGLDEINSKKNILRIDLKLIDDQMNQLKLDIGMCYYY